MNEVNQTKVIDVDTKKAKTQKVLSILIIVALCLMVPVLIINCTLLVKKAVAKDNKPPAIFGLVSQYIDRDLEHVDLKKGDFILIKTVDVEDVEVGDVIVYMKNAQDRDISYGKVETILEDSDGTVSAWVLESEDGVFAGATVFTSNLVGEYNGFNIPVVGAIANFMGSPWGIIICMAIPLGLLISYEVVSAKKKEKESDENKAELLAELEALRKEKEEAEKPAETIPEENSEDKAE